MNYIVIVRKINKISLSNNVTDLEQRGSQSQILSHGRVTFAI